MRTNNGIIHRATLSQGVWNALRNANFTCGLGRGASHGDISLTRPCSRRHSQGEAGTGRAGDSLPHEEPPTPDSLPVLPEIEDWLLVASATQVTSCPIQKMPLESGCRAFPIVLYSQENGLGRFSVTSCGVDSVPVLCRHLGPGLRTSLCFSSGPREAAWHMAPGKAATRLIHGSKLPPGVLHRGRRQEWGPSPCPMPSTCTYTRMRTLKPPLMPASP